MSEKDPLKIVGHTVADKYLIERLVGEGGFAVVYRAEHVIWKRPVAIKIFNGLANAPVEHRDSLQQAFINEGALLTELSSHTANIVQARDVGSLTTPGGQWMPFMVLEWLDGMGLDQLLEQEQAAGAAPWTLAQVLRLLAPIAAALELAHQRGVAHRDIKPGNIFVIGEAPRTAQVAVKLLDFGVAKMMTESTHMKVALAKTGTAITSFTPMYGAPEQFTRAYGATGPWTDVFALALVMVEMLAGRPALEGDDTIQLAFASSDPERRPTPRRLGVHVPDAVEAVFACALAPSPGERYPSAGAFWSALEVSLRASEDDTIASVRALVGTSRPAPGAGSARPPTPEPSLVPGAKPSGGASRGQWWLAALLVLGGVVLGLVLALRDRERDRTPRPEAVSPPPREAEAVAAAAALSEPAATTPCPDGMVEIRGGQFAMGSKRREAEAHERPVHQVKLGAFCMDLREVTAGAYQACVEQGNCRAAGVDVDWPGVTSEQREIYSPLCTSDDPDRREHPINCVTWHMAAIYCKAHGKRLPTEAEWEYAARGDERRLYPWGDEPPTARHVNGCGPECVAWSGQHGVSVEPLYDESDGFPNTAPVGSFPAGNSRFGVQDLAGNVWEWVGDWYGEYGAEALTSPTGPSQGQKRVIRGGAWNASDADWFRPSYRHGMVPSTRSYGIGFRCVKPI